ncbi:MAG: hypothetical protein WD877_00970 [Candidatus Saccharimonadales bacterium]
MAAIEQARNQDSDLDNPYIDVLPPRTSIDIGHFFDIAESEEKFQGYYLCAEEVLIQLDEVTRESDYDWHESLRLPLGLENGYAFTKLSGEMPDGTRALIELTYALTKSEIVGETSKKDQDIIYLHGLYRDRPIEFIETYTRQSEDLIMEWSVRLDEPIAELEDPAYDRRPATEGEKRELIDTAIEYWLDQPGYLQAA